MFKKSLYWITGFLLVGQVQFANAQSAWTGFGQAQGWKVEEELAATPSLSMLWEQKVGEGRAQVIGNARALIVASGGYATSSKKKPRKIRTEIAAYAVKDGSKLWQYEELAVLHEDQQTFGGKAPSPQATPLLIGNQLITVSFTGQLTCLNANDGTLKWTIDLVEQLGVEPVQFGFSSSPVRVPGSETDFVLSAGGSKGGLFQFSIGSSKPIWVCPIEGFSYSTPNWIEQQGVSQWVVPAQNEVVGISGAGKILWRFELPEQGLTNVPSALRVDEQHILVAGQGCNGTLCLKVEKSGEEWNARESWANRRLQFFYTNWLMLNEQTALGCTEGYLAAFDARTGEILGRFRDFRDGNLLRLANEYLLLDGKGKLNVLLHDTAKNQFELTNQFQLTEGRCWVAPTVIGDRMFLREADVLRCFQWNSANVGQAGKLENLVADSSNSTYNLGAGKSAIEEDPVAQILETFEDKGQDSALELYAKLRTEKKLTVAHRIKLAESAYSAGMMPLAQMIVGHALEDFPDSEELKRKIASWEGK